MKACLAIFIGNIACNEYRIAASVWDLTEVSIKHITFLVDLKDLKASLNIYYVTAFSAFNRFSLCTKMATPSEQTKT